jgi:hypothetical protein
MKYSIGFFIVFIFLQSLAFGQTMTVETTKGTDTYDLSKIDSITFEYTSARAYLFSKISTLYADNAFGLRFFPDLAVARINASNEYPFRMIVVAGITTWLFEGDSLDGITKATQVLTNGAPGEFDNGYAGIGGAYYHTDGKLYGLFHGEDQEDLPDFPNGVNGFYVSIGLAISEDNGLSFTKAGQVLICQKDKDWESYPGQADRGSGAPSCIKSKDGKYLYAYYVDFSRVDWRGAQIFMARADVSSNPPLPGNWYKYYNGSFLQPGIRGLDSPVVTYIDKNYSNSGDPFVTYSQYLDKYIMMYCVDDWFARNNGEFGYSGIYIAYSDDAVHWYNHERIYSGIVVPVPGETMAWHPAIIWDDAEEHEGYLVYAYSPSWGYGTGLIPHYMVRQRIRFDK